MPASQSKSRSPASSRARAVSAKADSLPVETSVDAFRRIRRALRVAARQSELATGLSAAQSFVLSAAAAAPGCSVNEIAQATMTDRSSGAAIIDRLVDQGYLRRGQHGEDRRRASITITARGRRAMEKSAPPPTALLIAGLRELPAARLTALSQGLAALTEAMGIANEPAGMFFEDARSRQSRKKSPSGRAGVGRA
jgi:DNA-binding MarR family transcriptional regulator